MFTATRPTAAVHVCAALLATLVPGLSTPASACRGAGDACYVPGGSEGRHSSCCGEDPTKPRECYGGCCLACDGPAMDPTSVCVRKNSTRSTCPHNPPLPPPPPPPRPCSEEVLASGIRLPCPWPPVGNMSRAVATPHYITDPPAVITVDNGRQLFVDGFLLDHARTQASA